MFEEEILVTVGQVARPDGDDVGALRDDVLEFGPGIGRIDLVDYQRQFVTRRGRDRLDPFHQSLVVGAVVTGTLGNDGDADHTVTVEVRRAPIRRRFLRSGH